MNDTLNAEQLAYLEAGNRYRAEVYGVPVEPADLVLALAWWAEYCERRALHRAFAERA